MDFPGASKVISQGPLSVVSGLCDLDIASHHFCLMWDTHHRTWDLGFLVVALVSKHLGSVEEIFWPMEDGRWAPEDKYISLSLPLTEFLRWSGFTRPVWKPSQATGCVFLWSCGSVKGMLPYICRCFLLFCLTLTVLELHSRIKPWHVSLATSLFFPP